MFFLIGPGRSGSTLIRKHLCRASNCFIPHEVYFVQQLLQLNYRKRLSWAEYVAESISIIKQSQDFQHFAINLDEFEHSLQLKRPKRSYFEALLPEFYYCESLAATGSNEMLVGDKSPINTFNACDLHKHLQAAKFIYILRSPIDVISSYISSLRISFDDAMCRLFSSYKCFWSLARRTQFKVIVYEQFLLNPDITCAHAFSYLGASPSKSLLAGNAAGSRTAEYISKYTGIHDHLKNVSNEICTTSVGKGLLNLQVDELCRTSNVISEFNKILTYSVSRSMLLH